MPMRALSMLLVDMSLSSFAIMLAAATRLTSSFAPLLFASNDEREVVLAARVTPRTTPGAGNSDGIVFVRSDAGTTALWQAGGDSRTMLCGDTDAVLATSAG